MQYYSYEGANKMKIKEFVYTVRGLEVHSPKCPFFIKREGQCLLIPHRYSCNSYMMLSMESINNRMVIFI